MAKEDVALKAYMSDKNIFADLINGSFFDGIQTVKPENLTQLKGETDLYLRDKAGNTKTIMRYRDVVMQADFAVIAEENQMNVHYAMPIRNMLYDALSYTEQVEQIRREHEKNGDKLTGSEFLSGVKKDDKIIPVITIVVYYGEKEWDASLDLYGMMGIESNDLFSKQIKTILPNYKINLLHAGNIENLQNYKSSLQWVFGMLKYKSDKTKLREYLDKNREAFEKIDEETYRVIGILLHEEKRLGKYRKKERKNLACVKQLMK